MHDTPNDGQGKGPANTTADAARGHSRVWIGLAFAAAATWVTWSHLRPEPVTPAPVAMAVSGQAQGRSDQAAPPPAGTAEGSPGQAAALGAAGGSLGVAPGSTSATAGIPTAGIPTAAGATAVGAIAADARDGAAMTVRPTALGESTRRVALSPAPAGAAADAPGAVRGVIKAGEEVVFSSRLSARIAEMPFKEGERFARGRPLVVFDCTRMQAEARAAWAAHRAAETVMRQSSELDRFQAIGRNEVEIARAKADQARAEAIGLDAQLKDCQIAAPFAGLVLENVAHRHEVSAPGKDLLKVINDETLEVHLVAPSGWLRWLKPGSRFAFDVDETGRRHTGRVLRLGASVDAVSQTIRVVGQLDSGRQDVLPGMSGSAQFDQDTASASPAATRSAPTPGMRAPGGVTRASGPTLASH